MAAQETNALKHYLLVYTVKKNFSKPSISAMNAQYIVRYEFVMQVYMAIVCITSGESLVKHWISTMNRLRYRENFHAMQQW